MEKKDTLVLGGHEFTSRFILGSGKFSVDLIKAAVEQGGAQMVTMALRRVEAGQKDNILDYIPKDVTLLPNTSSARNADEAVRIAHLSREVGCGDFIFKLSNRYGFDGDFHTFLLCRGLHALNQHAGGHSSGAA